jgi:hypothetical protein
MNKWLPGKRRNRLTAPDHSRSNAWFRTDAMDPNAVPMIG